MKASLVLSMWLAFAANASGAVPATAEVFEPRSLPVTDVERIYFSGPGTLNIAQGGAPGLWITGSPSLRDAVVVEIYDDALFIEVPAQAADIVSIDVMLGSLREIVSDGAARVTGVGLHFDSLSLEATGASRFNLSGLQAHELVVTGTDGAAFTFSGSVDRQVLDLADHGLYQAGSLHSRSVEASVKGAGYILLAVDELLDVRLTGAASVRYVGSPFVSQTVSGPGSVAPVATRSI